MLPLCHRGPCSIGQGMGAKRMPPQSCTHSTTRLQNCVETANRIVCNSNNSQRLCKSTKAKFLLDFVQEMLQKVAIIPVRMSATLGFYSRLFLVPKPGKKWRPVIDLSVLNMHLSVPTFNMETAEVIRNSICKGEWVVSLDLTDAYFHIPIHQKSQNLLRFHVGGRSKVQIQSPTFRYSDGSTQIYPHCQRGKAYAAKQRHSHTPVLRRLVTLSSNTADLLGAVKITGRICSETQLGNQLKKI